MVTDEQWEAVAADLKITVADLRTKIANMNSQDDSMARTERYRLPPMYFDWDLEPLTLGEWAHLFIARSVLPNRYWVATIWKGINEEIEDPPVVFESSIFRLDPAWPPGKVGLSVRQLSHPNLAAARREHKALVAVAAELHLRGPGEDSNP